ncbi:helix-turn-helix domain-containing protein [Haloarchaeobius litoreus]|uniref:Helix-turn-helix domain-containing protein n=1 Tax=Haloarchaeobius litoreus TaxID=755306 RepID=A0ABD6DLR5_9EURY|nr:helix-turn-helix domain-containing protein [Haloarchaeobius litoreus]
MKSVGLRIEPEDGSFPGVDSSLAALPDVRRDGLSVLDRLGDGTYAMLYRVVGGDGDQLRGVLADHEEVLEFDVVDAGDRRHYVFVNVLARESVDALLDVVEAHRLLLDPPFHVTPDGLRVTVSGDPESLREAFADVDALDVSIEVEWTGGFRPEEPAALTRLTDRQREALRVAHRLGFYETPREASYEEIGAELDCAPSTANELLRRAEACVVDALLDG